MKLTRKVIRKRKGAKKKIRKMNFRASFVRMKKDWFLSFNPFLYVLIKY